MKSSRKAVLVLIAIITAMAFLMVSVSGEDSVTIHDDITTSTTLQTSIYDKMGVYEEAENVYTWYRLGSGENAVKVLAALGRRENGVPILLVYDNVINGETIYSTSSDFKTGDNLTAKSNKKLVSSYKSSFVYEENSYFSSYTNLHFSDATTSTEDPSFMITRSLMPTFIAHTVSKADADVTKSVDVKLEMVDNTNTKGSYLSFDASHRNYFISGNSLNFYSYALFPEIKKTTFKDAFTFTIERVKDSKTMSGTAGYYAVYCNYKTASMNVNYMRQVTGIKNKQYTFNEEKGYTAYPMVVMSPENGLSLIAKFADKLTTDILDPSIVKNADTALFHNYNLNYNYISGCSLTDTTSWYDNYLSSCSIYVGIKGIPYSVLRKSVSSDTKLHGRIYAYTQEELTKLGYTSTSAPSGGSLTYYYDALDVNMADDVREVTTLTYDLTVEGPTESQGSLNSAYTIPTGSILYVPSDKKIVIEEGASFVVEGGSAVILHGEIENHGTLIVQPGGSIITMQKTDQIKAAIYNIGGSVLIRQNGKVLVRRFVAGVKRGHYLLEGKRSVDASFAAYLTDFYRELDTKEESTIIVNGFLSASDELVFNNGTEAVSDGGFILFGEPTDSYYADLVTYSQGELSASGAYRIGTSNTVGRAFGLTNVETVHNGQVVSSK